VGKKSGAAPVVGGGQARYEIPLIFDEIVTGFRFAMGGASHRR
jgi:hypothetical protein